MQPHSIPLCVDLDGTLIRSDLGFESMLAVIKRNPLIVLAFPFWILRGKAFWKRQVAARVDGEALLDVARLPYNREFLSFLSEKRGGGSPLVLTTASDALLAEPVARHLGLFDAVIASDGSANLKGRRKLERLVERFGPKGFDYAGNSRADLPIWEGARAAILVNVPGRLARKVASLAKVERIFEGRACFFNPLLKSLRLHQWSKNLLIFLPLMMAHRYRDLPVLGDAFIAFFSFSLLASAIYIMNDLFDLNADRASSTKSSRPLASGDLPIALGLAAFPLLLAAGFALAALLPGVFITVLLLYLAVTSGYSVALKHVPLIDVLVLAGLYSLRILAGSQATGTLISPWFLAFSMFLFLSLAFVKRVSEIRAAGGALCVKDRGYRNQDLPQLEVFGAASGYLSVLVLALYINSGTVTVLYQRPVVLWFACPVLLYWISRVWLVAHRGEMQDDPVIFAIKDKVSYAIGLAVIILMCLAGPK